MNFLFGEEKVDNFKESKNYENSLAIETKKNNGIYYTPKVIVDYILNKTIENHDILKNPYPRIIDLACGCGNFLLEVYDILYSKLEANIFELSRIYGSDYWKKENIHNHIITYCIYGLDIDEDAVAILKNSLRNKSEDKEVNRINIYCSDSLKTNWDFKFDYVVGNPPYVGHKLLDREYKKYLLENYSQVYKDKADLYFCFYKKIIDILEDEGVSSIITPRYFMESPSGKYLRNYIKDNINIEEMLDFLGASVFGNIGVSSCIMTFSKKTNNNSSKILRIRDENLNIIDTDSLNTLINEEKFEKINLNQDLVDEEWVIVNPKEEQFYKNIQKNTSYTLEDIATSFQGIITGCDKAFILDKKDPRVECIDESILKNWVKNKNIGKYIVNESNYKLIYSNDIDINEEKHKKVIDNCIIKYKGKLENRRECKKNIRKWHELQWGREKALFERTKIMYPYKCSENKFAIDHNNNYSSADVYSFYIKESYKEQFSYEYLVGILNSSVYDKYFKITAKKISKSIYDYYPNKVMKLKIFKDHNYKKIEYLSKNIINNLINTKDKKIDSTDIKNMQKEINILVSQSLEVESLIEDNSHINR
ncbi:SAM-dependent methyltransferase [Romboutsia weinsteinii]|uniref:site-specific DNA-methyltransferase (adenine-specific) n=1 Tax=Romboutsia weinsteinii TaxID=2020949 RepID=A0A371J3M0_9FIRM|nr:N-6 DNA methylase [Romboutsia weinsteinii]RDY27382.1 SAM-dependent methyltransferase [Romboutsia weinsteinii]